MDCIYIFIYIFYSDNICIFKEKNDAKNYKSLNTLKLDSTKLKLLFIRAFNFFANFVICLQT